MSVVLAFLFFCPNLVSRGEGGKAGGKERLGFGLCLIVSEGKTRTSASFHRAWRFTVICFFFILLGSFFSFISAPQLIPWVYIRSRFGTHICVSLLSVYPPLGLLLRPFHCFVLGNSAHPLPINHLFQPFTFSQQGATFDFEQKKKSTAGLLIIKRPRWNP